MFQLVLMEDLTKEYLAMFGSNQTSPDWEISVLGKVEKIPCDLAESAVGKMRLYDVRGVNDILEKHNYLLLRKPALPPFRYMRWINKRLKEAKRSPLFKEYEELKEQYGYLEEDLVGAKRIFGDTSDYGQMNQASIYGVRLKNFEDIVNPLFSASSFDVVNNEGENIRGVFVYEHFIWKIFKTSSGNSESPIEQLNRAKSAPDDASFNLLFHVLDQEYSSKTSPNKRGPAIKVLKIRPDDGFRKLETLLVM